MSETPTPIPGLAPHALRSRLYDARHAMKFLEAVASGYDLPDPDLAASACGNRRTPDRDPIPGGGHRARRNESMRANESTGGYGLVLQLCVCDEIDAILAYVTARSTERRMLEGEAGLLASNVS